MGLALPTGFQECLQVNGLVPLEITHGVCRLQRSRGPLGVIEENERFLDIEFVGFFFPMTDFSTFVYDVKQRKAEGTTAHNNVQPSPEGVNKKDGKGLLKRAWRTGQGAVAREQR